MGHSYPPFTQNKKLVIHTMTILGKFTSGSTIKVARGYDGSIYVCSLYMNILFFNRINSISFIHRNNEFTEQYSFLFPNIWGECQETCTQSPYNTHSFFFPPFPALCFWVVFNYPDMIDQIDAYIFLFCYYFICFYYLIHPEFESNYIILFVI